MVQASIVGAQRTQLHVYHGPSTQAAQEHPKHIENNIANVQAPHRLLQCAGAAPTQYCQHSLVDVEVQRRDYQQHYSIHDSNNICNCHLVLRMLSGPRYSALGMCTVRYFRQYRSDTVFLSASIDRYFLIFVRDTARLNKKFRDIARLGTILASVCPRLGTDPIFR